MGGQCREGELCSFLEQQLKFQVKYIATSAPGGMLHLGIKASSRHDGVTTRPSYPQLPG